MRYWLGHTVAYIRYRIRPIRLGIAAVVISYVCVMMVHQIVTGIHQQISTSMLDMGLDHVWISATYAPEWEYLKEHAGYFRISASESWEYKDDVYTVVKSEYPEVMTDSGRMIRETDSTYGLPVCVIGQKVNQNVFQNQGLHKTINVNGTVYEVVGICSPQAGSLLEDPDYTVYVPGLFVYGQPVTIEIGGREELRLQAYAGLWNLDCQMISQKELMDTMDGLMKTIENGLVIVSLVSVVIGLVAMMQCILYEWESRKKEIGIRKTMGQSQMQLMKQFFFEISAFLMGALGIGNLVCMVLLAIGNRMCSWLGPFDFVFGIVLGLGTYGIGILMGMCAVYGVSRLDAVECMR